MKNFNVLLGNPKSALCLLAIATVFAISETWAQVPPVVPDDQVPEVQSDISSTITSGSGYDGYSGSTVRTVNDIVVPNVVGDLGLSWNRKLLSTAPHLWNFSFPWRGARRPFYTSTVITYPDGSSRKFGGNPLTAGFKGREPGCHDRLQTWPDSSVGPSGYRMILHLADGGKVTFHGYTDFANDGDENTYLVDFIFLDSYEDRYGRTTTYTFDFPLPGNEYQYRVRTITAPGGQWLKIDYIGNGFMIDKVTASDGQWVDYTWDASWKLTRADYSDGTFATYTYTLTGNQTLPGPGGDVFSFPLPYRIKDVRAASRVAEVRYDYRPNSDRNGDVLRERHEGTGKILSTFDRPSRRETRGDTVTQSFTFWVDANDESDRYVTGKTDYAGGTWSFTYDSQRFLATVKDPLNRTTTFVNESVAGQILKVTYPDGKYRAYTYTDANNPYYLATERNERGKIITYTRFANGVVSRASFPDGSYEEWYDLNSLAQPQRHRLRNGAYEWFDYDSAGRLTKHWLPSFSGKVDSVLYTYYPDGHAWEGRLWKMKNARGYDTIYHYDMLFNASGNQTTTPCPGRGRITKVEYPGGVDTNSKYDRFGNIIWHENEMDEATTYTYDIYQRVKTETNPLGKTTEYFYQHDGFSSDPLVHTQEKPRWIEHPSGKLDGFRYDKAFRLIEEVKGDLSVDAVTTTYTVDLVGNRTKMTDGMGRQTTYTYDLRDRMTQQTASLARVTKWEYDEVGNVTKITHPDNTTTTKSYDSMNRVLSSWDELNRETKYTYHASGQINQITDARLNTHTHAYDASSRLTSRTYPGGSTETWTYDANGNASVYKNRSGQYLRYSYDERDRETNRIWDNYAAPQVMTTYDDAGRVTWKWNWHGQLWYTYDAAGQVTSEIQKIHGPTSTEDGRTETLSFTYDDDGNRESQASTAGTWVGYGYNGANLVSEVQQWAGSPLTWAPYVYNGAGERTKRTHYNGTFTIYVYDGAGRPRNIDHYRSTGTSIQTQGWGFDLRDRRTWMVRDGQNGDRYTYQSDGQLYQHKQGVYRPDLYPSNPASFTDTWTYDEVGNRKTWNENGSVKNYSANSLNQYTSVTGTSIAHADGRGNVTTWGSWTFTYDADNRLVNATGPGHVILPHYDPQGRLSKLVDNGNYEYRFYDGGQVFLRTNGTGTWIDFLIWGVAPDELISRWTSAKGWMFHHQDGLSSTIAVTDMSQNVLERYRYDAYGEVAIYDASLNPRTSSAIGNRWCFTGQEYMPEMGLHNFKNRFYHSDLGRFIQNDPIRFDGGDLNLYRYCFNDSINRTDPTGLSGLERCEWMEALGRSLSKPKDGDVRNFVVYRIDVGTFGGKTTGEYLREIGAPASVIAGLAVAGSVPTGTAGSKTIAEGAVRATSELTNMVAGEIADIPGPSDAVLAMPDIVWYKYLQWNALRIINNVEITVRSRGEIFVEDRFLWLDGWVERETVLSVDAGHNGIPQFSDLAAATKAAAKDFSK